MTNHDAFRLGRLKPQVAPRPVKRRRQHGGTEYLLIRSRLVEPRTGKELWKAGSVGHGTTPTLGEGHVVYHDKGRISCFRITPEAAPAWETTEYGAQGVGCIHRGVYLARARNEAMAADRSKTRAAEWVVAHDLKTGERIGRLDVPGAYNTTTASAIASDGRFFAPHGPKGLWMATVEGGTLRFVGETIPKIAPKGDAAMPVPGRPVTGIDICQVTTPLIADGRIYWRGTDSLWCYDLRKDDR